jgi:phosphatidate cytidylyltransferase
MTVRILVGLIGIPLMLAAVVAGEWFFNLVIIGISTFALWEFYHLCESKHAAANRSVGLVWSIAFQTAIAVAISRGHVWSASWLLIGAALVMLGTLITFAAELWRNLPNALLNTAMTIIGILYVTVSLSALMLLRAIPESLLGTTSNVLPQGATLVIVAFVGVWVCDSVAYFSGLAFGRHKLFPRVSPKKSWEGAIGGFLGSVVAVWALTQWLVPDFPLPHALGAGILIGIVGQIGDLAESLLKRDAELKDSSRLIPGHGGFLDRFDSMLFVAPVLLIYILLAQSHMWPAMRGGL